MGNTRIYLDHAATTPLRPEVFAAMEPFLSGPVQGNPSSLHLDGQQARNALDSARDTLASVLGSAASEIMFTSGGTEADNAALVGVILAASPERNHLITTDIEHDAVLRTAKYLERLGFSVTRVPVDPRGRVDPRTVAEAITPRTALISVMHANNEVGTVQPIAEIADLAHSRGILFHTDAVQTFGVYPIDVSALGVDLLSVSAHKVYGPKGVGALYVREGVPFEPLIHGGGQEREKRAGTENVAGIVGLATAASLIQKERAEIAARLGDLQHRFIDRIRQHIPGVSIHGEPAERLPSIVNMSCPSIDAESLLLNLDLAGISASSGSACTSGSIEPSHVLMAMGLGMERVRGAIRFSMGRLTTREELESTVDILTHIVRRLSS